MNKSAKTTLALLAVMVFCTAAVAQQRVPWTTSKIQGAPEPPPPYVVERIFPNLTFTNPLDIVALPGTDRLIVVEHAGKVYSFVPSPGVEKTDLFAELTAFDPEITQTYAITFHPKFAENRYVYIWGNRDTHYQKNIADGTRIMRFTVTKDPIPKIDIQSGKLIFAWIGGGHNGGNMRFGPDGMLYIATGDSDGPDPPDSKVTGQDISDIPSSILRIDVDHPDGEKAYSIPKDNPFLDVPKARGEVWAYGLRNPWRMSFNPKTGDLFAGDVGWELWEMIYRIQRGGNYGWSLTEGSQQDVRPDRLKGPTPVLPPLKAHPHEEAASITGGEWYFNDRLPELKGAYIYGDWQMGTFWMLRTEGDRVLESREIARSGLMPAGFGLAADGDFLITDYSGGGLYRLAKNPRAGKNSDFPTKLSQTGLFTDVQKQTPQPGVMAYDVNAPRWADHALAQRFVGLPQTSGIAVAKESKGVVANGHWKFPEGAVLAKTYSLEMERGNPATLRKIETQILHHDGTLWGTYTYRWNDEQTDAELVGTRGDVATYTIKDKTAPGGEMKQKWRFFSRSECARCHSMWTDFAPGFTALQLDRTTPEAGGRQLDVFTRMGMTPDEPKLVDPHGTRGSIELRARSYLHANCSACHRFNGGGAVPALLSIETSLDKARIIDYKPVQGDLGLPEARVIARGDPSRSVMLYRMATAGRGHMPYLGGKLVDDRGLLLIRDWINSMKQGPKEVSAATKAIREAEEKSLTSLKAGDVAVLDSLLSTNSGALSVLLAVIDGSLPAPARDAAIAKGGAIPDPMRRDLFERFLPESHRRQVLGMDFKPESLLAQKGDASRGKAMFAAVCVACHRVGETGVDFGPDLSHIGTKWNSRAAMMEQILFPSKTIEPAYVNTTVELKDGDSKNGFVVSRTDTELTLKVAGGVVEKIPAAQILRTSVSRLSIMPEGMLQSLTAQEAVDLLEYLESLK